MKIFVIFLLLVFSGCWTHCDEVRDTQRRRIAGIVKAKYTLEWNHGTRELDIRSSLDGSTSGIYLVGESSGFWEGVEVGDSIMKQGNSFVIQVFRSNQNVKDYVLSYSGCR